MPTVMTALQFVLFIIVAVNAAFATNYCDPELCRGSHHVACGNDGAFAANCINPAEVQLRQKEKNLIVHHHNVVRNRVAGGTAVFRKACRMATMQWDDELAALALLNVKKCSMSHDACHNTDAFKYSGQNLAWMTFNGSPNATKLVLDSMDMWFDEIRNTKMEHINKFPNNYEVSGIGHFTVIVADINIRVGCAGSTYTEPGESYRAFLFACNYAATNIVGAKMYRSCSKAASLCKTGRNQKYPNLCSPSEKYDVNRW